MQRWRTSIEFERPQASLKKDPLVEYKNEAFLSFWKLIDGIDDEIVK